MDRLQYKNIYLWFIIVICPLLANCNRKMLVKFEGIKLENVKISKNANNDSLFLSFVLTYAKKTFGKKAVAHIAPMIINNNDTIKFKTVTHGGCYYPDCACIPYKYSTTREYELLPTYKQPELSPNFDSGIFKILIFGSGNEKQPLIVAYQKEFKLSEIKVK